jgi:hypothetical protein
MFPEVAVNKILPLVNGNKENIEYLDYYSDSPELPERWFFYNVLGTLAEGYLQQIIAK